MVLYKSVVFVICRVLNGNSAILWKMDFKGNNLKLDFERNVFTRINISSDYVFHELKEIMFTLIWKAEKHRCVYNFHPSTHFQNIHNIQGCVSHTADKDSSIGSITHLLHPRMHLADNCLHWNWMNGQTTHSDMGCDPSHSVLNTKPVRLF